MFEITFELTHNCPFRCSHCSSISCKNLHLKEQFILDFIRGHIEKRGDLEIRISGGEPLFWKFDLLHLLREIRQLGCKITLLTTGTPPISVRKLHYPAYYMQEIVNSVDAVGTTFFGDFEFHASIVAPNDPSLGRIAYLNVCNLLELCRILNKETHVHVIPIGENITNLNKYIETNKFLFGTGKQPGRFSIDYVALKLLPQGRQKTPIPIKTQLGFLSRLPDAKLSHSFQGKCDIGNKLVVLPNGKSVHCSANKCVDLGCVERRCDRFGEITENDRK